MSLQALYLIAVLLGMFVGFAGMTYMVLGPLRMVLGFGLQGGVDVFVSVVFAVVLSWMLAMLANAHRPFTGAALLALPVCLGGLLFLGVGLFEAPKRGYGGERRDRLIVGIALMATAFGIVYLSAEQYVGLSDMASSVSNAPGP
jgi:hypothetical protein